MDSPRTPDDEDLIERLVAIARRVGLSPVKSRWKLLAWQRKWQDFRQRRALRAEHQAYAHHICPDCGGLADKGARTCPKCGSKLRSPIIRVFRKLGFSSLAPTRATLLLGIVILLAYVRVIAASPGEGLMSFSVKSLILNGGNHPASVFAGQYWRLLTALFLHVGVWHLAFNLMALAQVGPMVADVFGAGRMLFYFLLTGLAANVFSVFFGHYAVQAGASGAIMGLVGIAAGWGTRDGTTIGKNVRSQMVRWAVYTMLFGFFMHADNLAHGAGFVTGGVLGYASRPEWLRARGKSRVLGSLAIAIVFACLALIIIAPAPAGSLARARPFHASTRDFKAPTTMAEATALIADLTGARPQPLFSEGGQPTPVMLFATNQARASQWIGHAPVFLARAGATLFRHTLGQAHTPAILGLGPSTAPDDILRWVGTNAARAGKSTTDIAAFLRGLAADHPFTLTGAGTDFVEFRLHHPPASSVAPLLAARIHAFFRTREDPAAKDPDALATSLAQTGVALVWWD